MIPLVLASTSPRRQSLLEQAGMEFSVLGVCVDESWHKDETPNDYLVRMVRDKAQATCPFITDRCLVITADTIGVFDGQVFTKPTDKADAFAMWAKLSNNTHEIRTAVAISLMHHGQVLAQRLLCVSTSVTFAPLSHSQQETYWLTGEPADKAGAYAIQGGAASWVVSINGSYTNVVGLPMAQVLELITCMRTEYEADSH